ncbi:hypothetical protein EMCG_03575 [[Emmonsia] crescens]|uniref:Uncharacterized protein n=1 Tax=[Emmonsia] crescens TaxID=73230 RepID=A0A0G2J8B8_9EURO|nr:hypothetical protein EMCG_03575 [Emmonsia crescens UAMH 3008]
MHTAAMARATSPAISMRPTPPPLLLPNQIPPHPPQTRHHHHSYTTTPSPTSTPDHTSARSCTKTREDVSAAIEPWSARNRACESRAV